MNIHASDDSDRPCIIGQDSSLTQNQFQEPGKDLAVVTVQLIQTFETLLTHLAPVDD